VVIGLSVVRGSEISVAGTRRDPEATRAELIGAARKEFEERGFDATQSNKIARRAGYAPQTFYRHFTDKVDILLAVYADWVAEERKAITAAGSMRQTARALLDHHRASLRFRRALRALTITDERVRAARAETRVALMAYLRKLAPHIADMSEARLARSLFVLERVADACAEGEFADLKISPEAAEEQFFACLWQEFGPPPKTP
jgi:AcrR family transcriptional regulator